VCDIQGNLVSHTITLRPAINLLVLTLLHYGRCSKIVCMFELEVTWSVSELSMYFKISHKNKLKCSQKNSSLSPTYFLITCSYSEELIKLRRQWSIISDTKIRRRQKIPADNLIFGSIIGGNCLLPPKIARTGLDTSSVVFGLRLLENLDSLEQSVTVYFSISLVFPHSSGNPEYSRK
jgi:hypothetical protein